MPDPPPLSAYLAWLESVTGRPCACRWQWKSLGLTGPGWVRVSTVPGCLAHGKASRG